MSYSEIYTRINWENEPDTSTPLDKDNLNHMDAALKAFDLLIKEIGNNAMVAADVANCLFGQPTIDQSTGVITFPKKDGGSYTLDTLLEKVIVNFDFDETTQIMTITLEDGTTKTVNLSSFITETEFDDSSTIDFSQSNHHVTAVVKAHSIGPDQLQQDYLSDCETAADSAEDAADDANADALKAEGHAVGKQNGVDVDSSSPYYHNNAKYYKEQAEAIAGNTFAGLSDVDLNNLQDDDVPAYNSTTQKWENKPQSKGVLPHVIVISDAGSTVTLTKGTKVVTAAETSTGHFEADVDEYGTWTIDSILSGDDAQTTLNIDAVKIYTITDEHFSASITVSYPSGGTCTLSATGQTPQAATSSPYTFTVHAAATYTLTATYRGATRTATVVISTTGQTEIYSFLVDGATVMTTDDVEVWLDCACLWDKNYTTLAEVIGDSEALLALISDNNAVDYMVRSYGFANSICADPLAMLYIGQYNYCANKLLERNRNYNSYPYWQTTKTIDGITYTVNPDGSVTVSGVATANSNITMHTRLSSERFKVPNGSYRIFGCPSGGGDGRYRFSIGKLNPSDEGQTAIAHDYGEGASFTVDGDMFHDGYTRLNVEIIIYSGMDFTTPITFYPMIVSATDTDDTWEPYLPWLKPICDSEYFDLVLNVGSPIMTGNTSPSGEVTASSLGYPSSNPAYYAFSDNGSGWVSTSGQSQDWVMYEFPDEERIIAFSVTNFPISSVAPKDFKIQGSDDGSSFVDLYIGAFTTSSLEQINDSFLNQSSYRYYRILITSKFSGNSYSGLKYGRFYGRADVTPPASRTLKTFATANEAEIVEMICKADRGEIDLYDDAGWRAGQEHNINIKRITQTISGKYTVSETQPAHTATIVLSNHGGVELVNSVLDKQGQTRTQCSFEYDWKNCFPEKGYMNNSQSNSGSWDECARRKWCNYGLRNAVSPYIRAASKQFKTVTAESYSGSTNKTSNDYFALRAEKELFGSQSYSNSTEAAALSQKTLYDSAASRTKLLGDNGSATPWWERSPNYQGAQFFCNLSNAGEARRDYANSAYGISPFGAF